MTQNCHKALQLREIIDVIASHADDPDALSLLYTSQTFFYSAIRHVWGRRAVPAQDLLQLLTGFTYRKFRMGDSVKVSGTYTLLLIMIEQSLPPYLYINVPRPLPAQYFDRFNLYAPHIRGLDYYLVELLEEDIPLFAKHSPSEDVRFLLDSVHSRLLLPNLDRLTLGRPGRTWCQHHDLSLLTLLLPPSLAEFAVLEFACFGDELGAKRFFGFLSDQVFSACPRIQDLYLFDIDPSGRLSATRMIEWHLFEDLATPTHLSSVSLCAEIVNTESIDWISKLPDLSSLTFRYLVLPNCSSFQRTAYPGYSFQNLRVLALEFCELKAVTELWKTPIISQLEQLTFLLTTCRPGQIQLFFDLLANRSRHLKTARITNHGPQRLLFTPSKLESQPQLNLVDLFLGFVGFEGDRPIYAIAMLWPSLRRLSIKDHSAKLEEFLQLPALLPHLEYLLVGIPGEFWDIPQLMKIPLNTPKSVVVSSLKFCTYLPLLDDEEPKPLYIHLLARFFVQWWPGVQLSPIHHPKRAVRLETYGKVNAKILELEHEEPKGSSSLATSAT